MTVKEAFQAIVDNSHEKSLNYAVNYAKYGLTLEDGSHEMEVQYLYVLGNISHWRGELAKQVRATLKEAVKAYKIERAVTKERS